MVTDCYWCVRESADKLRFMDFGDRWAGVVQRKVLVITLLLWNHLDAALSPNYINKNGKFFGEVV